MELVVGASSGAVKSLVNKLGSLLAQEYTVISGVRDDIQYINDELSSMQAFLDRLRREVIHDEQRQDWMKQVREVAYDIEDCVDDVSHRLGAEPRGSGRLVSLRRAWYLFTTLYARRCIAADIGNLKARAHHVNERRTRYAVENLPLITGGGAVSNPAGANAPRDRLAPPRRLIGTTEPVGMDEAINDIEPWFFHGIHHTGEPRYLAIVGFGGLSKTTLAMTLYRNFGDEFDCKAFVLASQKFHLQMVLRSLVKQFHEQQPGASRDALHGIQEWGDEELKNKLTDQLRNKRDSLPKNDKGASIVVTTRFISVAEACRRQQGRVLKLKQLSQESSYNLFLQIISANDVYPTRPIDAQIIMKTCGGLPLAIVVVAGLIASKMKSNTDSILDHHLVEVEEALSAELGSNLTTEGVSQIINHCYKNLPAELKTCLLYLSTFPKGRSITRKHLIRRWIAEGFITEKHGKTVDEVAEDCFNELIGRNLIRPISNSSSGKVKSCQIHDMVLEYIVSKSSDENFITIIGGHWQTPFPSYKLQKICKMHQLKYLSLRWTDIHKIPSKIGRLEYLEVLDIRDTNVRKLPASVDRLQRMTHLLAGNKIKRIALTLTEGITKMTSIQTLSGIEICGRSTIRASASTDAKDGDNKRLHGIHREAGKLDVPKQLRPLAALEKLTNLKKLAIYRLVKFHKKDNELLLSAIEHLSSCSLKFLAIDDSFTGFLDSSLSSSQAPPEHLYTLQLSGKLSRVPPWIDRLHNLEKLTLSLTSLTTDTLDGGFKKLKLLRFAAPVLPPLSFLEGAMLELERLELSFRMLESVNGLENLAALQHVYLRVSSQASEAAKVKISQIKGLASMIQKAKNSPNPSVVIDEYNELSKE
ncbi:hypothetical protein ABZP36_009773 [Zizania latifolia]